MSGIAKRRFCEKEPVYEYTLKNKNGVEVCIINYACAITKIIVPDKNGKRRDIVLGYDTLDEYKAGTQSFGAFIGRYANRIKNAEFELGGKLCTLPKNDGGNHLHGHFSQKCYPCELKGDRLVFHGISPDGEEGFPAALCFSVSYTLTDDNELVIDYVAESDADTVLNFTNHSYFNLNGHDGENVLNHVLKLSSDSITECDKELIPTGKIISVEGTPLDFRCAKPIGKHIREPYYQLKAAHGYDHNYILGESGAMKKAGSLYSPETGIEMSFFTTEPAVQLYTANFLSCERGKCGAVYPENGAVCLEAQHYPDSPNNPSFPTTVLEKGELYRQTTIYKFSVK